GHAAQGHGRHEHAALHPGRARHRRMGRLRGRARIAGPGRLRRPDQRCTRALQGGELLIRGSGRRPGRRPDADGRKVPMPLTKDEQSPPPTGSGAAEDAAPKEPAIAASGASPTVRRRKHRQTWRQAFKRDWQLYSLALLPLIFFAIFKYGPMVVNIIAFRRFRPGGSIFGDEWVGLRYIEMFINDPTFWHVFANTAILGGLTLLVGFPLPIVLALMLNEVRKRHFKKVVQSISYLPHFLSVVIVVGMLMQLLSLQGTVNQIIEAFGGEGIPFLQRPEWFRTVYVGSEVWQ